MTPTALATAGMTTATNAADPRTIAAIDAAIAAANASGDIWDANTIRPQFPTCRPQLIGARVHAAALRKPTEQTKVGMTRSTQPEAHGAWIAQWRGTRRSRTLVAALNGAA